ncbi:probable arabinosyltransferase ARAD1 isoform X2 [Oryza brachyantha]|uniref:probable arabinosyltransferase ARAD1 isoform X2 n=1 Tax=Oryza brachyantha TaxID=4533 RepID=UPI001ADC0B08|nr:probable arabinosyltransferase ARAD1 isoform X2 [Oryza brachyantha]
MWERGRLPRKPRQSPIVVPPPPSPPPPPRLLAFLLPRSLLALAARGMPSRRPSPLLLLLLALALAFIFLLLSPSSPSASHLSSSLAAAAASSVSTSASSSPTPVKIYMYDLPAKFTYGVVRSYMAARARAGPAGAASAMPDDELRYPGHQHSAEWWLFKDLRRRGPRDHPVARVDDPAEADLFYVPFFSSLSLVVNPIRPSTAAANASNVAEPLYSDESMQDELLEWLERQPYWRRHRGRDHVFICQDPNALYSVVDRISNAVLLVSDFGRLRSEQASLIKDVILPYSHRINSFQGDVGVDSRSSLLFFMGNRYRKEGGKVRDTLFQVLENEADVIIKHGTQSRESRRMATRGMHSSKFCLHPADVIDYSDISIFVETSKAVQPGYLTSLLRGISSQRIIEYQREIKKVKHYFEYEDPNGPVNEIWRQVSLKAPLITLLIHRDKRLVERGPNGTNCSCICSTPKELLSK